MELVLASLVNETLVRWRRVPAATTGGLVRDGTWSRQYRAKSADMLLPGSTDRFRQIAELRRVSLSLHARVSLRSPFCDADRLRGARHGIALGIALAPPLIVAVGVGIARTFVLAIGIRIEERAIAGFGDNLLRHCGRRHHG